MSGFCHPKRGFLRIASVCFECWTVRVRLVVQTLSHTRCQGAPPSKPPACLRALASFGADGIASDSMLGVSEGSDRSQHVEHHAVDRLGHAVELIALPFACQEVGRSSATTRICFALSSVRSLSPATEGGQL